MTSTARIEANRRNAQKSTGPKTDEGKARAAQNALKHGLTAQTAAPVAGEKPSEFETVLADWTRDLDPRDVVERTLVQQAARASLRLKRCARAEDARLAVQVQHAAHDFERQQRDRAHEIGTKLLFDPLNRYMAIKTDPESLRKLNLWRAVEPAILARELESFAAGVDWMLVRWLELHNILEQELYWHYPEKFAAIRLMGKRTDDGLSDPSITRIMMACQVLHPEPLSLLDEFIQASLGREGRPMYDQRVAGLLPLMPTREEALAWLRETVAEETERLKEIKAKHLDALHTTDRHAAVARAYQETTPEAVLARRYETACQRDLHRALAALQKLRAEETRPAPEPEPEAPEDAPAPNGPNRRARRAAARESRRPKGDRKRPLKGVGTAEEGFQPPA